MRETSLGPTQDEPASFAVSNALWSARVKNRILSHKISGIKINLEKWMIEVTVGFLHLHTFCFSSSST